MRTVKSLHAEREMSERYSKYMSEYRALALKSAAAYFPYSALTFTFLPYCASCLVLYYGAKLIGNDKMKSGELVSFVFYMQSLFSTFTSMSNIYVGLVQAMGAADKVYEWLRREPKITPPEGIVPLSCSGLLEIRDVTFAYPQRPNRNILRSLSIVAEPGRVLALCGASGGNKSLADIISPP